MSTMPQVADAATGREELLAARARAGDMQAFGELIGRLSRRAFAIAWRILRQREDAEDLVQDACIAALEGLPTYQPGRPFAPWFLRIVANRALNAREKRERRIMDTVPDSIASPDESPDRALERDETGARVRAAIAALPERTRLVLELFELEGESAASIAAMLGMSPGTVRWHAHAGRTALRQALGDIPDEPLAEERRVANA